MHCELWDFQTSTDEDNGRLTAPDGRSFSRRSTRMSRRIAAGWVRQGAPVVLSHFGHGRFEWHDGDDATAAWEAEGPWVINTSPTAKQLKKHHVWNAGLWEADDGSVLVHLDGSC